MTRTAQISKEKRQSIVTLGHEGQSMRKISRTVGKTFQVKLVERMPRVCKAVIKANGGFFEESKILNIFRFV